LDERDVVGAGQGLQTERLPEVSDADATNDRQFIEADPDVLEGNEPAGEIELRHPVDLLADIALGAQAGAAETGRVLQVTDDRPVATALIDNGRVRVDTAPELEGRLHLGRRLVVLGFVRRRAWRRLGRRW